MSSKSFIIFLTIVGMLIYIPSSRANEEKTVGNSGRIIITADEIKEMNVRTVVELLNQIPGVDASEHTVCLQGSYMVRVLLDGRPIHDPLSSHRAVKWNLVSINNIERIEIYREVEA
ncbi:MAG: Plug domain-containing protein [Syntrophales bacterium]|nr:Plug domain-containing protein [Syntrophales bacterium]